MRGVVVVLCLVVAGCDVVWRLDDVKGGIPDAQGPDDDAMVTADAGCMFGPRLQIQSTTNNNEPTLSADGLELFFMRGASGTYDLWRAMRAATSDQFQTGTAVTELNSTAEDTDPAITEDGLMIVFRSTRTGVARVYQSTRAARGQPFSTPAIPGGLTMQNAPGLDISPDGLTIYLDDGAKLIYLTRPSRTMAFGPALPLTIDRTGFPSVSADGLELYYNGAGVIRRTRPNLSAIFDGATATVIDSGGGDADVTSDGKQLVFVGGNITYLRDHCAP